MKIGSIFGGCIGVGMLIGLIIDQKYLMQGAWAGIALASMIIITKNKKDEKK